MAVFLWRLSALNVGAPGSYPTAPPLILADNALKRNGGKPWHLPSQTLHTSAVLACHATRHLQHHRRLNVAHIRQLAKVGDKACGVYVTPSSCRRLLPSPVSRSGTDSQTVSIQRFLKRTAHWKKLFVCCINDIMKMKDVVGILTTALVRVGQLHDVGALSSDKIWLVM
jgi:hypothetical protein